MTTLRTDRLILRRARMDDLEAMHAVLSNEVAMRFWSSPPHDSIDQTRSWLADMCASPPSVSEDFIVELEGRAIGKVGAYRLPEFGFILHPRHWGVGLAREAVTGFLAHAFQRSDISSLTADVDPRNSGSLRLLRKLGFVETGRAERTWHTHIGWGDSVYFRMDRPGGP